MHQAWHAGVLLSMKAMVFKGLVINTFLSGLEAETLRQGDCEKNGKCMMHLARRAFGSLSTYQHEGQRRQYSKRHVRGLLNISSTCGTQIGKT